MNIKTANVKAGFLGTVMVAALQAATAFAQPAVIVQNDISVQVGTPNVTVDVSFDNDGTTVTTADFMITYDPANLTPLNIAPPGMPPLPECIDATWSPNWVCSNPAPGTLIFTSNALLGGLPDELIGSIQFDTSSAAVGVYPLPVSGEFFVDITGMEIPPVGTKDGQIIINEGPLPEFSSTPATPPGIINLAAPQGQPNPTQDIVIWNSGDDGTALTGTCALETRGSAIGLSTDGMFTDLPADGGSTTDTETVFCSTAVEGMFSRTLTCTHNGSNGPTSVFTINCNVGAPPAPTYGSNPPPNGPFAFGTVPQNNPVPNQMLLIDNDFGEVGSTLMGECSLVDGTTPIGFTAGMFSVPQGDPAAAFTVSCDTTQAQGPYNDTIQCTHNDAQAPEVIQYPVSCAIGPPDPAVYASVPGPGTHSITPIEPALQGEPVPPLVLDIFNDALPGDDFLDLQDCQIIGGSPQITANPPVVANDLNPGQHVMVEFSCDTADPGNFSVNYECPFDDRPSAVDEMRGIESPAMYTIECDVRVGESDVEVSPPNGQQQSAEADSGGSHTFDFLFTEILDDGVDAELLTCSLASNTDFQIITSTVYPQTIPAGGSVTVSVTGTDPGDPDTITDTLTCLYADTQSSAPQQASWPLEITFGGDFARFLVHKDFDDDNPAGVAVTISCTTGLPLEQTKVIHDNDIAGDHVEFVLGDFDDGEPDCDITEVVPLGYAEDYESYGGIDSDNGFDGCLYENVEGDDEEFCLITNELQPVVVEVDKLWFDERPEFNNIEFALADWVCYNTNDPGERGLIVICGGGTDCGVLAFFGDSTDYFEVYPHWNGTTECDVHEVTFESGIIVDDSDCQNLSVTPGVGNDCTITNTRFYEGIPTLSQYGLAILALLMLGVGLIGFRRFA